MPDSRIPTENEIKQAAQLLLDGGFNDKDPEKAAYANQLVEGAGSRGGHVVALIANAAAELDHNRNQ